MGDTVKGNTKVYVAVEDNEGVYKAPSAGSEAVQALADGIELVPQREFLQRNVANGSVGRSAGKAGQRSITGAIPVEMKAGSSAGAAPEWDALMRSALGGSRNQASAITASDADGSSYSSTQIALANADANKVRFGDIIIVRRSSEQDHICVVKGVNNTAGSVSLTVAPAYPLGSFADGDQILPFRTYICQNSGHPSLSITKEVESAILEKAIGCRVSSVSLNNWTVGQLADFAFGIEGLTYGRELASTGLTPSYDTSTPPLILNASVIVDGEVRDVSEVALSLENTLGFKTTTRSPNGRIASRITDRAVTGSFNPYKQDDDIMFFSKFDQNLKFDLLMYAYNIDPMDSNHFKEMIAIYLPSCRVVTLAESDQDGLLQDAIEFEANRDDDASLDEIFITVV